MHLALRDGDVIRAVIRNTAANQDGHTPGITLPSADAQEALIRKVYAEAGLDFADTSYVEAHGTGTPAGDPVEAAALAATFGMARPKGQPLYIGSIKSNIGHLEGGSGLVQVVKSVLMLEQAKIPPVLYYERPSPRIPMEEWNLCVPIELTPWPTTGPRRISINSFGYGGSNAHAILDDAYHYLKAHRMKGNHNVQVAHDLSPSSDSNDSAVSLIEVSDRLTSSTEDFPPDTRTGKLKLLVWSSHEHAGVQRTSADYSAYLTSKAATDKQEQRDETFGKFVNTLTSRRSQLPWKSFVVAGSCEEAASVLQNAAAEPMRSAKGKKVDLTFVFTGQGAQWFAMGRELLSEPVFRRSLEKADQYMQEIGASWSLMSTSSSFNPLISLRVSLLSLNLPRTHSEDGGVSTYLFIPLIENREPSY